MEGAGDRLGTHHGARGLHVVCSLTRSFLRWQTVASQRPFDILQRGRAMQSASPSSTDTQWTPVFFKFQYSVELYWANFTYFWALYLVQ